MALTKAKTKYNNVVKELIQKGAAMVNCLPKNAM